MYHTSHNFNIAGNTQAVRKQFAIIAEDLE